MNPTQDFRIASIKWGGLAGNGGGFFRFNALTALIAFFPMCTRRGSGVHYLITVAFPAIGQANHRYIAAPTMAPEVPAIEFDPAAFDAMPGDQADR